MARENIIKIAENVIKERKELLRKFAEEHKYLKK